MGKVKVKAPERSFVLRLPENQALTLNKLCEVGAAKSTNELIVKIIAGFLADLTKEAKQKHGKR